MIDKENLIIGQCYFLLGFYDDEMSIPDIESYIYVGGNLLPSDKGVKEEWWYFQNPETYMKQGCFVSVDDKRDCGVLRANPVTLEMFHDLEGLIRRLSEIRC